MTPSSPSTRRMMAALLISTPSVLWAGPGHDHGDTNAPVAAATRPRFDAHSEHFELVGIFDGRQLTLYLDRYADNTPVSDARLELDIAGRKLQAQADGNGLYHVPLETPRPGRVLPVTVTVMAGPDSDLLAGELDLHDHAPSSTPPAARAWPLVVGAGIAALAVIWALFIGIRRWRAEPRTHATVTPPGDTP